MLALTPPPDRAIPVLWQNFIRTFNVPGRLDTVPSAHSRSLASVRFLPQTRTPLRVGAVLCDTVKCSVFLAVVESQQPMSEEDDGSKLDLQRCNIRNRYDLRRPRTGTFGARNFAKAVFGRLYSATFRSGGRRNSSRITAECRQAEYRQPARSFCA